MISGTGTGTEMVKRRRWACLLAGALALGATLAGAQTPDETFAAEYWQRFVAVRKLDPASHPQKLGALTAWNSADSVYLLPFDFVCPVNLCSECQSSGAKPHAVALPFHLNGDPVPFSLVRVEGAKVYLPGPVRARAIFALADGRLFGLEASWNGNGAITAAWKEGRLGSASTGSVPYVAFPAQDFSAKTDSAALVLGSLGLGVKVEWTQAGFSQTDLRLPFANYSARGGRYVGAMNGAIYRFDPYPTLVLKNEPTGSRVLALDSTAALFDNHDFGYQAADSWHVAPQKTAAARAFAVEWDAQGLKAKVWGNGDLPQTLRLPDAPGHLYLLADDVLLPVNGVPFHVPIPTVVVRVQAMDQEGNADAPVIRRVRGNDTLVVSPEFRKTVPGWGPVADGKRGPGCAADGVCLEGQSESFKMDLGSTMARISVPVLRGTMDKICPNQPYFYAKRDSVVMNIDIRFGDELQIAFGGDLFRAMFDSKMGIARIAGVRPASTPAAERDLRGRIRLGLADRAGKGKSIPGAGFYR